jgi:MraZ protein
MPDYLKTLANIGEGIFVQGGGRFFTLWNPAELKKMGDDWAAAKAACEALVGEGEGRR